MNRRKRLAVLLGVLAVCAGGAVIISRINFEEKMTGTTTKVVDVDSAEITYLAWNYEDEVAFVREDGEWEYEADEKMSVDQNLLDEIAENLSQITSDKRVEEVKTLGIYGLSDPAYTITIEADETYEISIGDETFSDGEVYISTGDDYVYLTDSELIENISYSLLDCVQKEEIPDMETISSVSVEKEKSVDIVYEENSGYCYSDAYTYYLKDGDEYRNLDNTKTEETFAALSEFAWEECVDYYAEDSELASYGLDEPDAAVTVVYLEEGEDEKQEFSYEVGTSGDAYYAKLKDSSIVYSVSEDVYNAAVDASYKELKPDEVILLDWDTVESIDIGIDGNIYEIEIESSEDGEYTCSLNGSEIEFGDILDQISDIAVSDEEEAETDDSKAELSFTFHRNTETYDTVELEFDQYNGAYCIAVLNGEDTNCVEREAVIDLKEAINSVILDSTYEE